MGWLSPHPPLRGTLSQRERDNVQGRPFPLGVGVMQVSNLLPAGTMFRAVPLPLGEGAAKRRVRVSGAPLSYNHRIMSDDSYNPGQIEPKWREYWISNHLHEARNDDPRPKYYCLDM